MHTFFKKGLRGFTLIELLVVIAIIGILASVVLVSLNSARNRGNDAAVKANLSGVRTQAELFYDTNGNNYSNLCTSNPVSQAVAQAGVAGGGGAKCNAGSTAWAAFATLREGGSWCVDSTGFAGATSTIATTSGITVCN